MRTGEESAPPLAVGSGWSGGLLFACFQFHQMTCFYVPLSRASPQAEQGPRPGSRGPEDPQLAGEQCRSVTQLPHCCEQPHSTAAIPAWSWTQRKTRPPLGAVGAELSWYIDRCPRSVPLSVIATAMTGSPTFLNMYSFNRVSGDWAVEPEVRAGYGCEISHRSNERRPGHVCGTEERQINYPLSVICSN